MTVTHDPDHAHMSGIGTDRRCSVTTRLRVVTGISPTTVRALLDLFASDWTVRSIENLFVDVGLSPLPADEVPAESGVRRQAARQFIANLDLADPRDSARLLPVFDEVLSNMKDWRGNAHPPLERLLRRLHADGYDRAADGKLRAVSTVNMSPLTVPEGVDESVLREHLGRLEQNLFDDPAAAIGASKDLVESACKLVLTRMQVPHDGKADVPVLVRTTLKALKLHPDTLAPTAPAVEAAKRILSALGSLAVGVAELRNAVGTGHGRAAYVALAPRHAHLAVGSATTFVRMLLETLEDPSAPWRPAPEA